jgi:hypothetical protein
MRMREHDLRIWEGTPENQLRTGLTAQEIETVAEHTRQLILRGIEKQFKVCFAICFFFTFPP